MTANDPPPPPPPSSSPSRGARRLAGPALAATAAALSALAYAAYTGHVWEDFFITFRHSRNLADGYGLVYQPGERVHGFTSPLGTLLPALCHLVTGRVSYWHALQAYRVLSIAALAGGAAVLVRRMERERERDREAGAGGGVGPAVAVAVLYAIEVKGVAFAVNGMETGFVLLFLAGNVLLLARQSPRRWAGLGACWAGLMWSRPDGCILIAALTAADLVFGVGPVRRRLADAVRAAGVCTALYLPWFAWAWWYYGSPVPQTVRAKTQLVSWVASGSDPVGRYAAGLGRVFLPIYHEMGEGAGWYPGIVPWCTGLGLACAGYWLLPVRDRLGRACSFAFALVGAYLSALNYMFPWYAPPALMLALVVVARAPFALLAAPGRRWGAVAAGVLVAVVAAERGLMYAMTAYQMKVQTAEVELGNRARVGLWLRDHVRPGETVYLECVGYIGYFSGAHMLDWPGLVSPRVTQTARRGGYDFYTVVAPLRPDWVVLRPWEIGRMARADPTFPQRYGLAASFDVSGRLSAYPRLPGRGYLTNDAMFYVFHLRESP